MIRTERERVCRQMTELSPLPIVYVEGPSHLVRYTNPAFLRLVERDVSEIVGRPFAQMLSEFHENDSIALLDRVYSTGRGESLPHQEHRRSDNTTAYWSYAAWAVTEQGRRVGTMLQITDTTEAAHAQRLVTVMNENLTISNVRQHELQEVAESASRAKDRFLATLSHELRTPLTPILVAAQLLERRSDLPGEVVECIRIIRRNVALEARLIDDLLDLNRIIHGKVTLRLGKVNLHELIEETIEMVEDQAYSQNERIFVELDASSPVVVGDPVRIQQILWNLLSNAVKFAKGGDITIRARNVEADKVAIQVIDSGKGIDADTLSRLFAVFEQGEESVTRDFGGMGLGLAISRSLAEMHGGELTAYSEGIGKGATFTVTFPVEKGQAQLSAAVEENDGHKRVPKRILLVEDNLDSGRLMKAALDSDGYSVRHAVSVASAIQAAAEEPFDLLLCDLALPDGSGIEVLESVHDQIHKSVAISGFGMDEDIRRSKEAGFDEHLTKPVDLDQLERVIERL